MSARAIVRPLRPGAQRSQRELPDAELVNALKRRDPDAGELLYDRLIRVIEWTILRVVGVRCPEHEDLVQSAFEQVVKTVHSGSFRQNCALTSWASSIACNLALTAVRKRKRDHLLLPVDELALAPAHENPETSLHARRQLHRLRVELAAMNPDRAAAVVLHDVNGLDLRELASVRGELVRRMPDLDWSES